MNIFSKNFWWEGPGSFVLAILFALMVRWLLFEPYAIPSTSMVPTLLVHDHIVVNKIAYGIRAPFSENWWVKWGEPQRGDVVVFKLPANKEQYYVKRVVGAPGDRVAYDGGRLYINEKPVERTIPERLHGDMAWLHDADFPGESAAGGLSLYVHWEEQLGVSSHSIVVRKDNPAQAPFGPITVPANHYFVLGDNRDNSQDSRVWDEPYRFVPRENLIGRATLVWLSCESTLPVVTFLCNPLTVRWSRFFHFVN